MDSTRFTAHRCGNMTSQSSYNPATPSRQQHRACGVAMQVLHECIVCSLALVCVWRCRSHLLETSLSAGTATSMSTRAKLGFGGAGPCSAGAPFFAGAFFFFSCTFE